MEDERFAPAESCNVMVAERSYDGQGCEWTLDRLKNTSKARKSSREGCRVRWWSNNVEPACMAEEEIFVTRTAQCLQGMVIDCEWLTRESCRLYIVAQAKECRTESSATE